MLYFLALSDDVDFSFGVATYLDWLTGGAEQEGSISVN
jgi:hypothetical protein